MTWKNEFVDGGFNAPDATVWALRSDLARILRQYLAKQPQTAIARKLGISQGVVSNIMTGRIDKISVERLIRLLVLAGIPGTAQWAASADAARAVTGTWIEASSAAQTRDQGLPHAELNEPIDLDDETQRWLVSTRAVVDQTAQ